MNDAPLFQARPLFGKGNGPLWHRPKKMRRSEPGNLFVTWWCGGRTVNPAMRNEPEGDVCAGCTAKWSD